MGSRLNVLIDAGRLALIVLATCVGACGTMHAYENGEFYASDTALVEPEEFVIDGVGR
jgi:hypothetical protein